MRFVAYYRVSTAKQGASGLGLEAQRMAVAEYLAGVQGAKLLAAYTEVESGRKDQRPELARAMAEARLTGAKLVIAKLDRLSRNVHFLSGLRATGVDFVACDMPMANKLTVNILAAVAEDEAERASARTKAALAAAKARGVKLGGFRGVAVDPATGRAARTRKANSFARELGPVLAELAGQGPAAVARALEGRGILTSSGGQRWTVEGAKRLLSRWTRVEAEA